MLTREKRAVFEAHRVSALVMPYQPMFAEPIVTPVLADVVAARERTEEELRHSEEKYRRIIAAAADAILVADAECDSEMNQSRRSRPSLECWVGTSVSRPRKKLVSISS